MSTEQFRGLGVAMVTPFNQDKEIDYDATEKLIEHLVTGGVDFLVVMGTTGESATLTDNEKRSLIKLVIKKNDLIFQILIF